MNCNVVPVYIVQNSNVCTMHVHCNVILLIFWVVIYKHLDILSFYSKTTKWKKVYCLYGLERNLSQEPDKYNFIIISLCVCYDNLLNGICADATLLGLDLQEMQIAKSMPTVVLVVMGILKMFKHYKNPFE